MTIAEFCNREVVVVATRDITIRNAAKLRREHHKENLERRTAVPGYG